MRTLSCNCLLGKSSSSGKNGHMFNRNELLLLRYYHYPHFILAVKSVNTVTEFTYHQNIVNSALYTEKIKISLQVSTLWGFMQLPNRHKIFTWQAPANNWHCFIPIQEKAFNVTYRFLFNVLQIFEFILNLCD